MEVWLGARPEIPRRSCGGAGEGARELPRPPPKPKAWPTMLLPLVCGWLSALPFAAGGGCCRTFCWFGRWVLAAVGPAAAGGTAVTSGGDGEGAGHGGDALPVVVGGPRVSHLAKAWLLLVVAECMRESMGSVVLSARLRGGGGERVERK